VEFAGPVPGLPMITVCAPWARGVQQFFFSRCPILPSWLFLSFYVPSWMPWGELVLVWERMSSDFPSSSDGLSQCGRASLPPPVRLLFFLPFLPLGTTRAILFFFPFRVFFQLISTCSAPLGYTLSKRNFSFSCGCFSSFFFALIPNCVDPCVFLSCCTNCCVLRQGN